MRLGKRLTKQTARTITMSCRVPETLVTRLVTFFERQALGEPSPSTILMKALECYLDAAERYGI
ncbi:MAG: hypothetical protein KGP14_07575, partial [Betaproteobacteria bacterium]|nr:hypothetical protein [Betaproteobacteria bacterium]